MNESEIEFILEILKQQKQKINFNLKKELQENHIEHELIKQLTQNETQPPQNEQPEQQQQLQPTHDQHREQQQLAHQTKTKTKTINRNRKPKTRKTRKKQPNLNRNHLNAHQNLIHHFFNTKHSHIKFLNQFKLPISLFNQIHVQITNNDPHFTQRKDALGNLGHSSHQKVLAAIRQLVHGIGKPEAILDQYIRMAESTALETLLRFCYKIDELYGPQYLRDPTQEDIQRISQYNHARGFPEGLLGYLGLKWWHWDHCPSGWAGRFKTATAKSCVQSKPPPTIILEALVSYDGWIWTGFLSTPGSCKDIQFSHPRPPLYSSAFRAPLLPASSTHTNSGPAQACYLAAPIYPPLPPFISLPASATHPLQNDFDRTILQLENRFRILTLPCRLWSSNSMAIVIKATIILHNMIVHHNRFNPPPTSSRSSSTTTFPLPASDIQVNLTQSSPSIPPHVFATLNHHYKSFNPSSSLIPQ